MDDAIQMGDTRTRLLNDYSHDSIRGAKGDDYAKCKGAYRLVLVRLGV